jgi:predicted nucleic acid-binding protein
VRFTLDSNILVYAIDAATPGRHSIAKDLVVRALKCDLVLTVQALAEFLAVVRRKYPGHIGDALAQAERWASLMPLIATDWSHVFAAAQFSRKHGFQLWDSIIWHAARSAGAAVLVSEDLQDGFSMDGMTVLDPFAASNARRLADLLG